MGADSSAGSCTWLYEQEDLIPIRKLSESLSEKGINSDGVCAQCDPVLSRHVSDFKSMMHQGTKLKSRKSINPHPKCGNFTHYCDIVRQNEWLRSHMFDSLGNYLWCSLCICAAFGISRQE